MRTPDKPGDSVAVIETDFTELARLVGLLRALADELSRNDSLSGHLDDPDLADALCRVERNWHKQRGTMQTFLDSAAGSVAVTLAAYRRVETGIAKAAAAGAGRPS
jgi:hypothetical protein